MHFSYHLIFFVYPRIRFAVNNISYVYIVYIMSLICSLSLIDHEQECKNSCLLSTVLYASFATGVNVQMLFVVVSLTTAGSKSHNQLKMKLGLITKP